MIFYENNIKYIASKTMYHLAEALTLYANAIYPPCAHECSQVSRAALLDAIANINSPLIDKERGIEISRRLKTNINSALHYAEESQSLNRFYILRMKSLAGEAVTIEEWVNLE